MNSSITQYIQIPNNLFALLSRYRVVIPGIQRHYVQGANTPKALSIREQFVNEILSKIENAETLHLHFIYGPINTDGEDSFVPVDGQQRLTTLWLIARYAVERLNTPNRYDILKLLSRFTYSDRVNATRFCYALTSADGHWDIKKDACSSILSQPWFFDYWKEDETVASMLRMLTTIHLEWEKHSVTSEQVINALCNNILFELKIDSFGDDIYMKMNARGLQLTQWENFKSKFAENLDDYKNAWEYQIEELSNSFFEASGDKHELPDDAFFALIARIVVYLKKNDCGQNIKLLSNYTFKKEHIELPFVPYSDFSCVVDKDKAIAIEIAECSSLLIKTALDCQDSIVPYFGSKTIFDTIFHPENNDELDFSICCYEYLKTFQHAQKNQFLQATRLIWNILENVQQDANNRTNRISIIQRFIELNNPHLYSQDAPTIIKANDAGQVIEEVEKSVKIYDTNQECPFDWDENRLGKWENWQHAIEYAEERAFFNGSIRFLYRNSEGKPTWEHFATKLITCQDLFNNEGLNNERKQISNQVLISHCTNWNTIWRTPVFGSKKDNWKRILIKDSLAKCVNNLLLSPNQVKENQDNILSILLDNTVWKELIAKQEGYELEWKSGVPCLWLSHNLDWTLKLQRNNREDILDAFMQNPNIRFEKNENDRFLCVNGENYYYATNVFFLYNYQGKEYRFAWQNWGWLDMYERNNKLYDLYYKKHQKGFNIQINKDKDDNSRFICDTNWYIEQMENCINEYNAFLKQLESEK